MSKRLFTKEEVKILYENKYVKNISAKGITYTDEFKNIFIIQNEQGKLPRKIFDDCGFDINIIGIKRIKSAANRWRTSYTENGVIGLTDTRKSNTGRPSEKELSIEMKYERLQAQNNLLKAENEEIILSSEQKFIGLKFIIEKYKLKNMITYLCKVSGVSRSGYYNYFADKSKSSRDTLDSADELVRDNILKAYNFKGRNKGARQIKMTLEGQFGIVYNLKRIRRVMKKYNIICPIRKANPYRRMMKATREHSVLPNSLKRNFKQDIPGKVLLTDITYLFYGKGQKAYLSTIKDAFIHSDQGVHYTSPIFQGLVKKYGLGQSMSRRGNCWDNAPQEYFFGHFKDEAYIKTCETLDQLKKEIKQYMIYYNKYRYQWDLKKMTPVQYRNHLLDSA